MRNPSARRLSAAARARYGLAEHGSAPLLAVLAIVADAGLGAAVHYGALAFRTHLQFSLAVAAVCLWAAVGAFRRNMDAPKVRRAAMLMLSLTFSEMLLGVGSYMNLLMAGALQWFPIGHIVLGVASLLSAVRLAVLVYRRVRTEDAELAHGGIAIA